MKALRISWSEGLSLVDAPPTLRRTQTLRLIRLTAITFASFVVAQTVILYALDWAL